jgi:predicted  nucleic acid-binding Zn-ribbon protein
MSETLTEQLDVLIQIQDVDCLLRDLRDPEIASHQERLGFALEDLAALQRTRERLAAQVDPRHLQTYERMSRRFLRVIVPVEGRMCSGCRMSLPTGDKVKPSHTASFEFCENCGRILYRR